MAKTSRQAKFKSPTVGNMQNALKWRPAGPGFHAEKMSTASPHHMKDVRFLYHLKSLNFRKKGCTVSFG
uniref:Uncharacterized protein n=1 Tax=Anguilla anguilla TaxID=7936 RepID=A0A0E9WH10_ANGAN